MRVALINPKFRLPIDTRTSPHLALAYLGAVSERRGDEVRVYDADVEEQPLAEFLREFKPHLVGITTNTPQVKQSWRTAAAIKQELDIPIVLGGPHVSVVSEELDFESLRQPQVDLVVRGEGEGPWLEISNIVDRFLRDQPEFTSQGADGPGAGPVPRHQGRQLQDLGRPAAPQRGRVAHRGPRQPALARVPPVQDEPVHQPPAGHRCDPRASAASRS